MRRCVDGRAALAAALLCAAPVPAKAAGVPAPESFLGFRVGEDGKLARWDRIVEYLQLVANGSDRVRYRELGKSTNGNPFVLVEVSSASNLRELERIKSLQRRLYFQDGSPSDAQRDEIFRAGKAVVLVTCNIHATEIGASQMALELVHQLASEDSPRVRKILEEVVFLLVPSLNPDGQIMITDWYNRNVGTEYEVSPLPWLYHPYVGHDNNRDMYMFTQKESQLTARLLWHDWFPAVWLDEHQMGASGARIFTMPATDPINPNVHPLIYRWNGLLGQAQAAALEAAGKEGIIYNSTYTNFWQGAMAWSGWWHNQVGMLTEVASARIASPVEQRRAEPGRPPAPAPAEDFQSQARRVLENPKEPLPPPRDVIPRTEYPRPWLGGRWTLRDIVDYELIVTLALLEAAADRRERLLRDVYEVNRLTVENGAKGDPAAILIRADTSQDPHAVRTLVEKLRLAGVRVMRAGAAFEADGKRYPAGTLAVPMEQVFGRYAKDLLEKQTYPEVRRAPNLPAEAPYDVTAWSLGLLVGADVSFVKKPLGREAQLAAFDASGGGEVNGGGPYAFDYRGAGAALLVNRVLREAGRASLEIGRGTPRVLANGVPRERMEALARELGLRARTAQNGSGRGGRLPLRSRRIGLYQPWTANMDEGWTRFVLEQYGFAYQTVHNADVRAGNLHQRHDVLVLADQQARDIREGLDYKTIRPEYRGGLGAEGVQALVEFVAKGGTLLALGAACDLAIEAFPIPVRNLKRGLTREQHFGPGTIVRLQVDTSHPLGIGMPGETHGFYVNSPFFELTESFASQRATVAVRYPNANVVASGWLRGEELMAGRAAVVSIDMNPGRIVLFGIRPQHRAQTLATFPLLFNALFGLSGANP
jgi:hypothetical protein